MPKFALTEKNLKEVKNTQTKILVYTLIKRGLSFETCFHIICTDYQGSILGVPKTKKREENKKKRKRGNNEKLSPNY